MICPHCRADVRYRDRPDHTCSQCKREFALDPKTAPYRLHDLRVLRLADKLSTDAHLHFTYEQLRYAAGKRTLETSIESGWRIAFWGTAGALLFLTLTPGLPLALAVGPSATDLSEGTLVTWLFTVSACLIALSMVINGLRRPSMLRNYRIDMDDSLEDFAATVEDRWQSVYGTTIPGLVDERRAGIEHAASPRYAVLCPSRSVLVCLSWNGIVRDRDLIPVSHPDQVPPNIPVLVIHDASPEGLGLVAEARRRFGPRAVDVGLSPQTAMSAEPPRLWLRTPTLSNDAAATLPSDLPDAERAWLETGWWTPVSAVPPRRLIAAVNRAIDRFEPGTAEARTVGFLTWPTV
ncbi:hypothetical protein L5G28_10105 [Gordonia sp. HY285]|uniref:hypothetical protein n=1 Tax=Gordonia liuliyuniae TaxID=2911517 RepID=UPI001F1E13A9|nr:hypothetical protein [Gordonia liuliyuniae]MCF8610503.1 hypothetical protein [Gordonia liuliyuniae]